MVDVPVLHRGAGFAALNKPAGFAVAAERRRPGRTPLLDAAARALGVPDVLVVHRLDRETSGVLLVATEPEAHRALSLAFQRRLVTKTYVALVLGEPAEEQGLIDAPLEKDPAHGGLMRIAREGGKRSATRWSLRERFRGFTLLEVRPETGRQHQIRVHLKKAGMPLAVDPAYGGGEGIFLSALKRGYKPPRDRPEPPIISRVTLHAERLELADPSTGEPLRIEAPLAKDLARAIEAMRRYAARR